MVKNAPRKSGKAARQISVEGDVQAARDVIIGEQNITADLARVEALLACGSRSACTICCRASANLKAAKCV